MGLFKNIHFFCVFVIVGRSSTCWRDAGLVSRPCFSVHSLLSSVVPSRSLIRSNMVLCGSAEEKIL
jgi:hypothetical protein